MIADLLERLGVLYRWRAAMTLDLAHLRARPVLPAGYVIASWDDSRLHEVAELDYRAYRGTLDAKLYWRYFSSVPGCEKMWREALAGRFGRFDRDRTLLLLYEGRVVGDVMASDRTSREGFIGNLAVAPEHRGGRGAALLLTCLWRFREAGFDRVSLAVTLENDHAFRLYRGFGFVQTAGFPLLTRPPADT